MEECPVKGVDVLRVKVSSGELSIHPGSYGLLDPGEGEAIALARELKADWFLTDDAAARLFAQTLGIEVHGSLGVVLWAAATRHLDQARAEAALDRLFGTSLWISERVMDEARSALRQIFA
jgi:predicted nucleic acid-binding protein